MATARGHFAVTPHDTNTIYADALYVATGGDVTFKDRDGTSATWTVADGAYILCQATVVLDTGTDATGIVGLLY